MLTLHKGPAHHTSLPTSVIYIKRYLNVATIAHGGLLVVMKTDPLSPQCECIIVLLDGVLMALHIRLDHPTCHQLKKVAHCYLYALDMDKAIERTSSGCHTCTALLHTPHSCPPVYE